MSKLSHILMTCLILACSFPATAQAQQIEVGNGLVCDTESQVQRVLELATDMSLTAINAVNEEEKNPLACGVFAVAYFRGEEVSKATSKIGSFSVVRILVIGINPEMGIQRVHPVEQFTAFPIAERSA